MFSVFFSSRRRHTRYEMDTQLRATILGAQEHVQVRGQSLNINEGGMAGIFSHGWEVGTHVKLQFSLPVRTDPVSGKGVVRNRVGYCYGFEFVELTLEQKRVINRTCVTLNLLQ